MLIRPPQLQFFEVVRERAGGEGRHLFERGACLIVWLRE